MTFTSILNLSISAAWLTLAVLLARLILRRAPKALHCALWGLVALRLLLPVSLESPLSLQPSREVISQDYLTMEPRDEGFSEPATLDIITNPIYDAPLSIEIEPTADRLQSLDLLSTVLWLTGMGAMAIYAAYSYIDLRLRVRMAAWCSGNVWECDNLDSPFILGLLRPRIYLPPELDAGPGSMSSPMSAPTCPGSTISGSLWASSCYPSTGSIPCCGWPMCSCAGTSSWPAMKRSSKSWAERRSWSIPTP